MIKIEEIKKIDKKHIALMDTSSISFMQSLQNKEINLDSILKDYELTIIPHKFSTYTSMVVSGIL